MKRFEVHPYAFCVGPYDPKNGWAATKDNGYGQKVKGCVTMLKDELVRPLVDGADAALIAATARKAASASAAGAGGGAIKRKAVMLF